MEQHITPDVGFSMLQYYRWTGDKAWLKAIGYPIAKGVADWIVSRARWNAKDGHFHIYKVMPVDEWCDNGASGCGDSGVDDDPQMNGASIAALQFAAEAADALGMSPDPGWLNVSTKILLPYGSFETPYGKYSDVHLMPNRTVPFSTYMKNGVATVCPEDVMYLTYPMGPALNITTETTARDFDAWVGSGLTCLENGGMTHPIHAISLLLAKEHNASYGRLAERSLNGTMYGCCYGSFNMRNEVDMHNSTQGGHNLNTHFATGDGGFINTFVSGFGGLMLGATQEYLRLAAPTVPERTKGLSFKGLDYLTGMFDYTVTSETLTFEVHAGPALCLVDAHGNVHTLGAKGSTDVQVADIAFPANLGHCK